MRGTTLVVAALAVVAGLTACAGERGNGTQPPPRTLVDRFERLTVVNSGSTASSVEEIRSYRGAQGFLLEPPELVFAAGDRKKFAVRKVAGTDYASGFSCVLKRPGLAPKLYEVEEPDLVAAMMYVPAEGEVVLFGVDKDGNVVP